MSCQIDSTVYTNSKKNAIFDSNEGVGNKNWFKK